MPPTRTDTDQITPLRAAWTWLRDGFIDREQSTADFDRQRSDPRFLPRWLHRLHVVAAVVWCLLLPGPISVVEFAGIPLMLTALARLPWTWRVYKDFFTQPLVIVGLGFLIWPFITLLWTPDFSLGLRQSAEARWAWVAVALWPVIDHRPKFIAALAIGFLLGNLSQVAHVIGVRAGIDWLRFDRLPDRNSGWWKPVVGGTLLVAALGLHLPAALRAPGRSRWFGLIGSVVTLWGIVATGSRGAWLAGAMLTVLAAVIATARAKRKGRALGALTGVVLAGAAAAVIAWPTLGPALQRRAELAKSEITAALERGDYASDTGARVAMALWAWQAFRAHPMVGVGAGGYRAWVMKEASNAGQPHVATLIHDHAHNTVLQIGATTGLVGLALAGAMLLLALRNALHDAKGAGGLYTLGPFYALLGLAHVTPFDVVHLNTQTMALLMTLLALCPTWVPAARAARATMSEVSD